MNYRIILLALILTPSVLMAEIYVANNVEEINNNILSSIETRNAAKALVILPVKDFLIKATDNEFYVNDEKSSFVISKAIKKIKSRSTPYIDELILSEYPSKLADQYIPKFIQNLQKKNVPLIAVSRNTSGSFNKIQFLEAWTWKYLFDQGIDLSISPIGSHQIIFNKQFKEVKGTYPTYFNGLLSSNSKEGENSPQSVIVSLLLVNLKWMPDVVYIVDIDENYIKSMIKQFKSVRPNIQVMGFVYKPEKQEKSLIDEKDLTKFWDNLVAKLNSISRKEIKDKSNPYE